MSSVGAAEKIGSCKKLTLGKWCRCGHNLCRAGKRALVGSFCKCYNSPQAATVVGCVTIGYFQEEPSHCSREQQIRTRACPLKPQGILASINYSLVCSRTRTVVWWVRSGPWNRGAWPWLAHPWGILPSRCPGQGLSTPLSRWNVLALPEKEGKCTVLCQPRAKPAAPLSFSSRQRAGKRLKCSEMGECGVFHHMASLLQTEQNKYLCLYRRAHHLLASKKRGGIKKFKWRSFEGYR